jgi:hypothetical protein
MIAPDLALAMSMHSNKGVYALLLGSGVSRSAGIPTGWEVVLDLIRKLARVQGADCEPDLEAWYRRAVGQEPDYSALLEQVTGSSAERGQLLRGYFEPTETEREEGQKLPTPAHHAIAQLVEKGYVRVIVTTNFDRLLEQALSQRGIEPTVIASADAAHGALPLAHARCTIIKINGDYLDTRFRNTAQELTNYEASLNRLLDQVFDEYGLIVCGWSGDWDVALRAAIERCPTRRFTTFWAARGEPTTKALDLIRLRAASMFTITEADTFFLELLDKVLALESFGQHDPVSAQIAVARAKRYLTSDAHRISLHDLVHAEVDRAVPAFDSARRADGPVTGEALGQRLRQYEAALAVLLPVMSCVAYWSEERHDELLLTPLQRIANEPALEGGTIVWLALRRYPALLLFYAMGLTAVARQNTRFLARLLATPVRLNPQEAAAPAGTVLYNHEVLDPNMRAVFPGREREHTALNNHLFEILREPLRNQIPDERMYTDAFDGWEYLMGLNYIDMSASQAELEQAFAEQPRQTRIWAPVGRFMWQRERQGVAQWSQIEENGPVPEFVMALLKAGLFRAPGTLDTSKYRLVRRALDEHTAAVRRERGIW